MRLHKDGLFFLRGEVLCNQCTLMAIRDNRGKAETDALEHTMRNQQRKALEKLRMVMTHLAPHWHIVSERRSPEHSI